MPAKPSHTVRYSFDQWSPSSYSSSASPEVLAGIAYPSDPSSNELLYTLFVAANSNEEDTYRLAGLDHLSRFWKVGSMVLIL